MILRRSRSGGAFRFVLLRPSVGRVTTFTRSSSCHAHA
jgi:hypothetical protein